MPFLSGRHSVYINRKSKIEHNNGIPETKRTVTENT